MSIEFSDYKHIVYSVDDFIELLKVNLSLMLRITSKTALYFEDLVHLKVEDMSYVMLIRSLYNTFKYFSSFIQQCKVSTNSRIKECSTSLVVEELNNNLEDAYIASFLSDYEFNEVELRYLAHQERFLKEIKAKNQMQLNVFNNINQDNENFEEEFNTLISSICLVFYKFNEYLKSMDQNYSNIVKFISESNFNREMEEQLIEIIYSDSLAKHFCELLHCSAISKDNELFFKSPEDEEWINLQKYIEYVEIRDEEEIMSSYEKFSKWVILGISTFRKFENPNQYTNIEEIKNSIMKIFKVGFYGSVYFLSFKKRIYQYKYFVSNPDIKIACLLWNSIDLKFFSLFYNVAIPSVKLNQVFYIPRLYTLLGTSTNNNINSSSRNIGSIFNSENNNDRTDKIEFYAESSEDSEESSFHTNNREFNNKTHIMVRLLYNDNFTYNFKSNEFNLTQTQLKSSKKVEVKPSNVRCCMPPIFNEYQGVKDIDKLIIHIHGGGFISMSSNSHQIYTRIWTRDTKIPVISIDYRLAPEYPYPCALDDCWQVYLWIINCGADQLNINPKTIILVGDSAGGNLATSITILAIQHKVKVPDMLILPYPAMTLSKECMVPSIFYSLSDPILNLNFLNMCFDCYLDDENDANLDYLISPINMPEDILKKFPKI